MKVGYGREVYLMSMKKIHHQILRLVVWFWFGIRSIQIGKSQVTYAYKYEIFTIIRYNDILLKSEF